YATSEVLADSVLEDAAMRDYNSGEDSDYEEDSSCHSTKEDKEVPNTPAGHPWLVLPPPLPIPESFLHDSKFSRRGTHRTDTMLSDLSGKSQHPIISKM
ncbi:hypothetical protein PIB30_084174, partial [Stylosanthes scabra]|nr:hypothetical protein [Stylosanthes scabra]